MVVTANDYEVRTVGQTGRSYGAQSRAMVLGVTRLTQHDATYKVWAFLYNGTGETHEVALAPHATTSAGHDLAAQSYHPHGVTYRLAPGEVAHLWPAFYISNDVPAELSLDVRDYGRLRVPLEEKMTNLGPWETLNADVREALTADFARSRFSWWGNR